MWKTRRKHRRSSRARMCRSVRQTYTRADLFPNTIGDRPSIADHVRCVGFSDHAHAPFASDVGSLCDLHGIVGRSRGRPKPRPGLGITPHGITRDGLAYLRIGCRSIASVPPEFDGSVPGSFGSPAGGGPRRRVRWAITASTRAAWVSAADAVNGPPRADSR